MFISINIILCRYVTDDCIISLANKWFMTNVTFNMCLIIQEVMPNFAMHPSYDSISLNTSKKAL